MFYTDQEQDTLTGLYNYDARLYDPGLRMFISPDFIVPHPYNPQSFNRYAYVLNNPLRYTDPSGHHNEEYGENMGGFGGLGIGNPGSYGGSNNVGENGVNIDGNSTPVDGAAGVEWGYWGAGVTSEFTFGENTIVQSWVSVTGHPTTQITTIPTHNSLGLPKTYTFSQSYQALFGKPLGPNVDLPYDDLSLVPSERFLKYSALSAGLFSGACAVHGNLPGVGIFSSIAFASKALEASLYSDTPYNDTVKIGINAATHMPGPAGMIKDEIVNQAVDVYVEHVGAPEM